MGGELDGKQGTPQEQAGSLDAQGQAPAQQQVDTQAQDEGATNAPGQGAPGGQGSAPEAGDAHDKGRLAQFEKRIAELESQVAEAVRSKEERGPTLWPALSFYFHYLQASIHARRFSVEEPARSAVV